ncbi:senescence/dehydration-associated protein At4g35985, chloroplastic [Mercurialis annua]|uniref:senescence/dehydration-associated protein At4g35985, chloroplastic n=1 Tax=Mercurialis annua TaxID=3986 RepID=UPI00215F7AD5|nr:senescence/dehydration-associated protein At4g35985, chloroplastic [Mercurialis annua]
MGCFGSRSSKTNSPTKPEENPAEPKNLKQEIFLKIPACTVHLMEGGEAFELATGEFNLIRILDDNISLATIIKVGDNLQWPLTKDEPVVKLDSSHYLFSLPMKDGDEPLSYGITFLEQCDSSLRFLDSFLAEHSCFSSSVLSSSSSSVKSRKNNNDLEWKEFAPSVEDYNNFLAKAIAGGTGQIVKGIFKCSNAYTNQVHKGGEMIQSRAAEDKNGAKATSSNTSTGATQNTKVNNSLKRVRKLTKMTEKLSKTMLDGVGIATGSVMAPLVKSQAGKAFLSMVPGEVLLASLDAVNKILDAAEAAEKQTLSATSKATSRMVSNRFGESAGEATEDAFATAGHCAGTAWNIFKIRKALNPASSVSAGMLRTAAQTRKTNS